MTAIRRPDLLARRSGPSGAHAARLPDLRVPGIVRDASRADGMAASTALGVVGAALAGWQSAPGALHSLAG